MTNRFFLAMILIAVSVPALASERDHHRHGHYVQPRGYYVQPPGYVAVPVQPMYIHAPTPYGPPANCSSQNVGAALVGGLIGATASRNHPGRSALIGAAVIGGLSAATCRDTPPVAVQQQIFL